MVTGGAWFIGAALAERLVAAGHRVTAIDDCSTGKAERPGTGVALRLADIAARDLDAAFRSAAPEAVVHLAAMASIAASMRAPERCAAVNVCGMQTRDYVHLDDIVDAHLRVLDSGRDGVFNLGTGTQKKVLEVFETVAGAARRSCLDSARVPFTEGVGRTVQALAEARAR